MNLPDRTRPRLALSAPRRMARLASAAVWRTLHPAARERFVETPPPPAARRLHYVAGDGWAAPLFRVDPLPGAPAEPVLLAHGLGMGPDLYRYGADTLAGALRAAGFAPFLLTHRADADALPPRPGAVATLEGVVERDLPAALEAIATATGFPRVHTVGHGLGGLLLEALAGRRHPSLASVAALGAPLLLPDPPSEVRRAALVLSLLPAAWRVPLRALARGGAPFVEQDLFDLATACPAPRLRGALAWGVADPPVAVVRTVRRWLEAGTPSLDDGAVDLLDLLPAAEVPLLVATGEEDPTCPPAAGEAALDAWGHPDRSAVRAPGSHLDLLLGRDAADRVFSPLVAWLDARRRLAWAPPLAATG